MMKTLQCLLITALLTFTSYAADFFQGPGGAMEGFLDRPIWLNIHTHKGEDSKAISDQVELILIKGGAKIDRKGPYDHHIYVHVLPISVEGEIAQYYIGVSGHRTMEYKDPRGAMKSWPYASVFNTYGLCPKEKKRETINGLVNHFINEAKRAGKEKPKGK